MATLGAFPDVPTPRPRFIPPLLLGLAVALTARAGTAFPFAPGIIVEGDYRAHSNLAEGYDGFQLSRVRTGIAVRPLPWAEARFTAEWVREKVAIIDAFAMVHILGQFDVLAGYSRDPLFVSGRSELEFNFAVPERSITAQSLWPGRDLGVEVHAYPYGLPLEAWVRVGNGSGSPLGNDDNSLAVSLRADLVLGRERYGAARTRVFGFRLGGGVHTESVMDRLGVGGTNPAGFQFVRPVPISGARTVAEWHLVVQYRSLQLLAEAGFAREDRARDTDGNPATAREQLEPVFAAGASVELAWMLTGQQRQTGLWPQTDAGTSARGRYGAWEIAARAERFVADQGARDVQSGGAVAGALALRWWFDSWLALAAAGYVQRYDHAPIEEPGETLSWTLLLRATVRVE